MDKTAALKILKLDATASFEEAKKAYRDLAKQYHPDVMKKKSPPGEDADARMKQINLAFCHIAPLLRNSKAGVKADAPPSGNPRQKKPKKMEKEETQKRKSFLSKMSGWADRFFNDKKKHRPGKQKIEPQRPKGRSKDRPIGFEEVFKRVHPLGSDGPGRGNVAGKKQNAPKSTPYHGYQKYMVLKRKIKLGQPGRHQEMSIGRIEKIEPVKKVGPVGKA